MDERKRSTLIDKMSIFVPTPKIYLLQALFSSFRRLLYFLQAPLGSIFFLPYNFYRLCFLPTLGCYVFYRLLQALFFILPSIW